MFNKASFIWRNSERKPDEFAEFTENIQYDGGKMTMYITAGSDYNIFVNGKLQYFGQFPDYPEHRVYDALPLDKVLKLGENTVRVVVWYFGFPSASYAMSDAYIAYEITDQSGKVVAYSSEETLSRSTAGYVEHREQKLTPQLGLGWSYDPRLMPGEYGKSMVLPTPECDWTERPVKKTEMLPLVEGTVIDNGYFKYTKADERPAELMQRAVFSKDPAEGTDGQYWLVDLGKEYVGFPEFEFTAAEECDIMIGFGEHNVDGRCRTATRDYALFWHAVPGKNHFLGSFKRLGCRYLQFFVRENKIDFGYLGIRPVNYPVERVPAPSSLDELEKKIYDTCVYTLECCMHDHYEDCPWREQGLYTLDSRNQMLCGYYAFKGGNTAFARASLKLMSYGQRKDNRLLTLTFPTSIDSPIPYYTLAYLIQLDEYVKYSGDTSIIKEVYPLLCNIIDLFESRINGRGLLNEFDECWNYYEWSETMDGGKGPDPTEEDAPLAAFFVLALEAMSSISKELGKNSSKYEILAETTRKAIAKHFYEEETGLFRSFTKSYEGRYSVINNAVCLLCGAAEGLDTTNIMKILAANGPADLDYEVISNTLSMNSFRFDALLREDREKYAPVILDEIRRDYKYMLDNDATTFWETIKGQDDMWMGASLCHGWSALPVYYYHLLKK